MTTVQNHIKELLYEQDCVVIPDFGGFVTSFECAQIEKSQRYISAPQKWLAFNALLKSDDGLLANFIASQEKVSREDANIKIKSFVEQVRTSIRKEAHFYMDNLGTFTENEEAKMQFQPYTNGNFFGESFGMGNLSLKKNKSLVHYAQVLDRPAVLSIAPSVSAHYDLEDKYPKAELVVEQKKIKSFQRLKSKVLPYFWSFVGVSSLVSAVFLYDNKGVSLSSLNPFQSTQLTSTTSVTSLGTVNEEHKINTSVVSKDTLVNDLPIPITPIHETIKEEKNRFFVITGSFSSRSNAKKLLRKLKRKGFKQAILMPRMPNEKLIKVSTGGYFNETDAAHQSRVVAQAIGHKTWVFKQ